MSNSETKTKKLKKPTKAKKLVVKKKYKKIPVDELKQEFEKINDFEISNKQYNQLLLQKEQRQSEQLESDKNNDLYPLIDDPNFMVKIASKKEFYDTKYDGDIRDATIEGDRLSKVPFELASHQVFVRNFMSFQTPYNGLLLYHGLGSGKTCSAISICEEMRDYMKQMNINKRILIIASPNVQENFKLQLFDERKLYKEDGVWKMRGCTGNKFLKETNPTTMKGVKKEKIVRQVNRIINQSYAFLGYTGLANYISKLIDKFETIKDPKEKEEKTERLIKKEFENRLMVIDEVQNIRISSDVAYKRVANHLMYLAEKTNNFKMLLLSATPMFNNYTEIVWLLNLLNVNDGRSKMEVQDVFTKSGKFRTTRAVKDGEDKEEVGIELLVRKARGYISFVRGENPYTFPYRIFPSEVSSENTLKSITYPTVQATGSEIPPTNALKHLDVFLNTISDTQYKGYQRIVDDIKSKIPSDGEIEVGLNYTQLDPPIQALNMVYPYDDKKETREDELEFDDIREIVGKLGLARCMKFSDKEKNDFEYRSEILKKYGRIFSPSEIGKYSKKIETICNMIRKSKGIVLIYSQYIDGGCVPIALALEEMGITRYGDKSKSLFKKSPTPQVDYRTLTNKPPEGVKKLKPAKYTFITGDQVLSENNPLEIKAMSSDSNLRGEDVKVVIISKAASEGLDFKNIRQTHILEPWYNMMRIEQIIGRGVRNFSHISLPFTERNVQIFLHGTVLPKEQAKQEALDLYIYRLAERKSVNIGRVARILKENAVDCLLNSSQQNFTAEKMQQEVAIQVSTGETIKYQIGDKPFSSACDYMKTCTFSCNSSKKIEDLEENINSESYNEPYIVMYLDKILQRIKEVMKLRYVYTKDELIKHINTTKTYPLSQINYALQQLIDDENEILTDVVGNKGRMINIGDYYMFQPIELTDNKVDMFERTTPLYYKRGNLSVKLPNQVYDNFEYIDTGVDDDKLKVKQDKKPVKKLLKLKKIPKKSTDDKVDDSSKEVLEKKPNKRIAKKILTKKWKYSEKDAKQTLDDLNSRFNFIIRRHEIERGESGEGARDKFISGAIYRLKDTKDIPIEKLIDMIVHHLFDFLIRKNKLNVMTYILGTPVEKLTKFEQLCKIYIETKFINKDDIKGIILVPEYADKDKLQQIDIFIYEKGLGFRDSTGTEISNLGSEIIKYKIDKEKCNELYGFITLFEKEKKMTFKTIELSKKRNTGARCDQATRAVALKTFEKIVGNATEYVSKTTKGIHKNQLCYEQEFLLRYFDSIGKDGKRWFLSAEEHELSKE